MGIYILDINPEEIKNPHKGTFGELVKGYGYHIAHNEEMLQSGFEECRKAVLSHVKKIDLDEALVEYIRKSPIVIGAILARNPLLDHDKFSQFLQSKLADTQEGKK